MSNNFRPRDPGKVLDQRDPGDDIQRRFRYQHAYAIVLLCAAAKTELPYVELICENHEDILARRNNGTFDAFQVKTRKPERGPWKLTDTGIRGTIARFVRLDREFPARFESFSLVTNCSWQEASDVTVSHGERSPSRLISAAREADSVEDLSEQEAKATQVLATECDCERLNLLSLLRRVRLVRGPSLDDYETVISHDHLASTPTCSALKAAELNAVRDRVSSIIARASAVSIDEPNTHWFSIWDNSEDPLLRAKTVTVARFIEETRAESRPFRFAPGFPRVQLAHEQRSFKRLEEKLAAGGLESQMETFRRRTLSAERHLLQLSYTYSDPDDAEATISQLDSAVLGVCDDAQLEASSEAEARKYGPAMLRKVQAQLRDLAKNRSNFVARQPYECLVGVAGLLTDECRVWWSSEYDPEEIK